MCSFMAYHPEIDDPDDVETLVGVDGLVVAPVEFARHVVVVAARRLRAGAQTRSDVADALERALRTLQSPVARPLTSDERRLDHLPVLRRPPL